MIGNALEFFYLFISVNKKKTAKFSAWLFLQRNSTVLPSILLAAVAFVAVTFRFFWPRFDPWTFLFISFGHRWIRGHFFSFLLATVGSVDFSFHKKRKARKTWLTKFCGAFFIGHGLNRIEIGRDDGRDLFGPLIHHEYRLQRFLRHRYKRFLNCF